jgi:hypothetical protein
VSSQCQEAVLRTSTGVSTEWAGPFRLVRPFQVEFGVDLQKIVIADPYVGFGFTLDEANEGSVGWVRVLNLTTGTRTHNEAAADHFFSDVNDIELTPAGSVAWIARAYAVTEDVGKGSSCQPRKRSKFYCDYPFEVRKADDHRSVLLDRGVRVDPESLRLNGQRIAWLHDGVLRSGTLKGTLPLTGFPVGLIVFGGLLLLLAGAMIRSRSGFS